VNEEDRGLPGRRPWTLPPTDPAYDPGDVATTAQIPGTTRERRDSGDTASSIARVVTWMLAAVAVGAYGATLLVPDLLRGTAVRNGSAKGTALVALTVTAPILDGQAYRV
jgi:hypothetical protein